MVLVMQQDWVALCDPSIMLSYLTGAGKSPVLLADTRLALHRAHIEGSSLWPWPFWQQDVKDLWQGQLAEGTYMC